MLTFREFYGICEGKKPNAHPYAVPGTYQEKDGVKTYTLKRDDAPKREPIKSAKKITKMLDKQGGIGGKAIKKAGKKVKSVSEDLEARRQQLAQRQRDNVAAFKERSSASANAQKERLARQRDREQLKSEIKKELQTEQHPTMQPNEYNKQVARQSARWKGMQIRQAHGEMEHEAGAQLAAKKARLKAIMSR
jgi:hypothetical protein